jgi:hypothetical protein
MSLMKTAVQQVGGWNAYCAWAREQLALKDIVVPATYSKEKNSAAEGHDADGRR